MTPYACHKARVPYDIRHYRKTINGLAFSGVSLLSFKRWYTSKQSVKKGGMRTNDFKKELFLCRVTYQHRVRCIEVNKLLLPTDRLSLMKNEARVFELASQSSMRIFFEE